MPPSHILTTHIVVQASESRQELTQIAFGVRPSKAQALQNAIYIYVHHSASAQVGGFFGYTTFFLAMQ